MVLDPKTRPSYGKIVPCVKLKAAELFFNFVGRIRNGKMSQSTTSAARSLALEVTQEHCISKTTAKLCQFFYLMHNLFAKMKEFSVRLGDLYYHATSAAAFTENYFLLKCKFAKMQCYFLLKCMLFVKKYLKIGRNRGNIAFLSISKSHDKDISRSQGILHWYLALI